MPGVVPREFQNNDELEDYVTDTDYEDDDVPKICFAVVIKDMSASSVNWELRFNSTDTDPK